MQEHEKTFLTLFTLGALIGLAKLLVSDEKLTVRLIIGRTLLGSAASVVAGVVLIQIPNIDKLALVGIASALGIVGSSFIEMWLKGKFKNWN